MRVIETPLASHVLLVRLCRESLDYRTQCQGSLSLLTILRYRKGGSGSYVALSAVLNGHLKNKHEATAG